MGVCEALCDMLACKKGYTNKFWFDLIWFDISFIYQIVNDDCETDVSRTWRHLIPSIARYSRHTPKKNKKKTLPYHNLTSRCPYGEKVSNASKKRSLLRKASFLPSLTTLHKQQHERVLSSVCCRFNYSLVPAWSSIRHLIFSSASRVWRCCRCVDLYGTPI